MINELSAFPAQLKARSLHQNEKAKDAPNDFEKGIKHGLSIAYQAAGEELDFLFKRNRILFPDIAHDALCDGWTELARANSEDGN